MRFDRLRSRLLSAGAGVAALLLAAAAPADPPSAPPPAFLPLDAAAVTTARFGNDAAWYAGNIPLFESSDAKLDAVYYYRWSLFRAHQRDLGRFGYISTEFLDDVSWQREPYASLNDATGFHLAEARWLHDRRYAADYIDFLYAEGGNDRHFSEAIADSVWQRYLVDGDRAAALRHLPAMRHIYGLWDDHFDFAKGLYWIEPLLDATEYTISSIDASGGKDGFTGGHAFRPTINSYMVANARAIARLSALGGDEATAADYAARGERLRQRMLADLWSPTLGHFVDRYRVNNEHVRYWSPIRGRELAGYLPWTFGLVDGADKAAAWRHLLSPQGFAGAAGMRTVEPSYQYYMQQYRYIEKTREPECQWNGPVWPFQTTQVLSGLANLLHGPQQDAITRGDYWRLLRQYAALHYQGDKLDLEEDYHPESGRPIVGLDRSHHYFHSGFVDLIVTGLAGLIPQEDGSLVVDPLLPASGGLGWFALQDVPYRGHKVSIVYDADGTHYRRGAGLALFVDGAEVARRATLGRLAAPLVPAAPAPVLRRINLATELVRGGYPRPSAPGPQDAEAIHDAVDGRTWFFPELPNGWTSPAPGRETWFALDLGEPRRLRSAELAFFADATVGAPTATRLQRWDGKRWRDIPGATATPLANGITRVALDGAETGRVRLVIAKPAGRPVRLVEMKLYE